MHRFAITFHRNLHNKNSLASKLDEIKGIGPKSRNKLLKNFGSLRKIREASIEDLKAIGLTLTQAQSVKLVLENSQN